MSAAGKSGAGGAVVEFPDGTRVRGRGLSRPVPGGPPPDFGLYLGARRRVVGPWPQEWVVWPDFLLPIHPSAARDEIVSLHGRAQSGAVVEVACHGGTGRTGTVLACLATLAGVPAPDAVAWVREHYRPRAVETPWQRRWVSWFARRS